MIDLVISNKFSPLQKHLIFYGYGENHPIPYFKLKISKTIRHRYILTMETQLLPLRDESDQRSKKVKNFEKNNFQNVDVSRKRYVLE